MLGKLLKYEIKATARWFLPFYGALIVLAVINRVLQMFHNTPDIGVNSGTSLIWQRLLEIPSSLTMMMYVFTIIALLVITILILIQRFYKNLLSDEGYLMFTLPVSTHENILSKLITALMWSIASILVTVTSVMIMVLNLDVLREFPHGFAQMQHFLRTEAGVNPVLFFILMCAAFFVGIVVSMLQVYVSIAIGQLSNNHKVLLSIGAYAGINIAMQIICGVASAILGFFGQNMYRTLSNIHPGVILQTSMLVATIVALAFGVAFYLVTHYLLSRKLNLE